MRASGHGAWSRPAIGEFRQIVAPQEENLTFFLVDR